MEHRDPNVINSPIYKKFLQEEQQLQSNSQPIQQPQVQQQRKAVLESPEYKRILAEEYANAEKRKNINKKWEEDVRPYIPDFTANLNPIARVASLFADKKENPKPTPTENFALGGIKSIADYTASANKLLGNEDKRNKWSNLGHFADEKLKKNDGEIAGFVGEMIVDPFNLAPAGLVTKGQKLGRIGDLLTKTKKRAVATSMAGGAAVGAGTMFAKDYGNDRLTQDEKNSSMGWGAGFVAGINGIIAGVTKGRVTTAFNADDLGGKNPDDIANSIMGNHEDLGLSKQEAEVVSGEILQGKYPKMQDEFKVEQAGRPQKPYEPNFQMRPNHPPATMDRKTALDILLKKANDDAIARGEAPRYPEVQPQHRRETLYPEQPQQPYTPDFVGGDFNKNIPTPYSDTANLEARYQKIASHPRLQELLKMRESVSAKESASPQNLVSKRDIRQSNTGKGWETDVTPASYEKNYNYDFTLTKQDIAKLYTGKHDENLISKLETDLETLDNHPEWSKTVEPTDYKKMLEDENTKSNNMTPDDWDEANAIFSKGADNLAVGAYAGIDQDEQGNITFDAEKFLIGLGGYTAVKQALKNKQVQGKLKEYAQKAIDTVDMSPQVHKENGLNAMSNSRAEKIIGRLKSELEYSKLPKEQQDIYDVYLGNRSVAEIKTHDLDDVLELTHGSRKQGARKIIAIHGGEDAKGGLTPGELVEVGEILRNGKILDNSFTETDNSIRYAYIHEKDGISLRVVVEEFNDGKKVFDYYSDRNFIDYSKGVEPKQQPHRTTPKEIIIPQENKKLLSQGGNALGGSLGGGTLGGAQTAYEDIVEGKDRSAEDYLKNIALGAVAGGAVGKLAGGKAEGTGLFAGEKAKGYADNEIRKKYMSEEAPKKDDGKAPTKKEKVSFFKNSTDTLERLAKEKADADWKDITQNNDTGKNIKNTIKEYFMDTMSGKYHEVRDDVHTQMQRASVKIERLATILSDLDEVTDKELYRYLTGQESKLPEKMKLVADNMRKTIDDLGAELVRNGLLEEKGFKEWQGVYLYRQYEPHMKQKGIFGGFFKKGFKIDKVFERGISDSFNTDDLKGMSGWLSKNGFLKDDELVKFGNARDLIQHLEDTQRAGMLKDGKLSITNEPDGKIKFRRDFTKAEREAMGEVESAKMAVPNTLMKLNRMIEHAKFLQSVKGVDKVVFDAKKAKEFSATELDRAGYIKLDGVQYGALNGKFVRRDVADDIGRTYKDISQTHHDAFRVWNGYHGLFKKSKTVWSPTAHANNFGGNAFLMQLGGKNASELPAMMKKSYDSMKAYSELENLEIKKIKGALSDNEKIQYLKLKERAKFAVEAKENGVFGRSKLNDILSGMENNVVKKGALSKLDTMAEKAYQFEDDFNRLSFYLNLRESGKDAKTAKQMIDFMLPDYSKPLPRGWRFMRDTSIAPFISWSYYTMPSIVKMLGTKEGAKNATKVLATISAIEYVLSEGEISPMDNIPFMNTDKPEDFKGRRFAIGKDGDKINTIKLDRVIPYAELQNPLNFVRSQFGGMLPNLFHTMNGMQMYNGRPITYKNKDTADKAIDWVKHLAGQYTPVPTPVMGAVNLADKEIRGKEGVRRSRTIEPKTMPQSIMQLLGVNTMTYDKRALKKEQKD